MYVFLSEPTSSRGARLFSYAMLLAVAASIGIYLVSSMSAVRTSASSAAAATKVDFALNLVFTAEITLRLATCPSLRAFVAQWLNVVDTLAILPSFLELALGASNGACLQPGAAWGCFGPLSGLPCARCETGARHARAADVKASLALRALRLLRVVRVVRLGARYHQLDVIFAALHESLDVLAILVLMLSIAGACAGRPAAAPRPAAKAHRALAPSDLARRAHDE